MNDDADLEGPLYLVACAAIRHQENHTIICGARHYDNAMRNLILFMCGDADTARKNGWYACEQGFVNNKGEWMTRETAWIVAERGGQLRPHPSQRVGVLHSEDLY